MQSDHLTIGFVRRGFSRGGGAEAYLKRLAEGVVAQGHQARLYTAEDWPPDEWTFGPINRFKASSATHFADEMARRSASGDHDVLMSLERIWRSDVYRAGDGVHRAWLQRRAEIAGPLERVGRFFNRKHAATLALEKALFSKHGTRRVIANSTMVKEEIGRFYDFPSERIDVVYNGVPLETFRNQRDRRATKRAELGLADAEVAVLFAGNGWERKGLRFAIEALEAFGSELTLLVAGRGEERKYRSPRVKFLGVVQDMPGLYAAADIFLLPTLYDPFSNACLEALAAGLPVITTRANGFSEIIRDGREGSVIDDARDVSAIRTALQLWADPVRREQAQPHLRQLAQRFDISANVARTLEILFQVADSAAST
jgi:UDP-glucose:(heptosyl)LPS alpha-1,3-glucosyltransferase